MGRQHRLSHHRCMYHLLQNNLLRYPLNNLYQHSMRLLDRRRRHKGRQHRLNRRLGRRRRFLNILKQS